MPLKYPIGTIFFADKSSYEDAIHPIVYFGPYDVDPSYYKAVMLTHSPYRGKNIAMSQEHFDKGYKYQTTYVVSTALIKPVDWIAYIHKGCLSDKGIKFILDNIDMENPRLWSNV